MLGVDFVGVGTLITTTGAVIVSIIVALRQTSTHRQIEDVRQEVVTGNGTTIGLLAEATEQRRTDELDKPSGG